GTGEVPCDAPWGVGPHIPPGAAVLAVAREEDAFAIEMPHPIRALTGSLHAVLPDATLYVATATVEPVVLRIDTCAVAARIAEQGVAAGRAAGDLAREGRAALVGVVAFPRPVLAEPTGVTSPGRPRSARFRGGQIQQRPHREQDRDQPKDTSSLHGSLLPFRCLVKAGWRGRLAGCRDLAALPRH